MERSAVSADANGAPDSVRPPYLSAIASESSNTIRARTDKEALRPIYLNGVEVGFAYAQNDVDKRLSVRGLTIALFHFLAAGHQVLALLPHCFKLYREKSTDHEELIALHRMNLVEFTPGFGSDKYVEVNRLAAGAAYESGGCIVARSQMHAVVSERPCLEDIVEKRLLMPSFMGEDIIFPIDGPLGRIGPSLADTLICRPSESEWAACSRSQLTLADQIVWLQRLSNLLPEKLSWSSLASHFATWQPPGGAALAEPTIDNGLCITLAGPIRPPESNPHHGRGFSAARRRGNQFARDHYNCPERLRDTKDPAAESDDDDDFLPSYAVGDRDLPREPVPPPPPLAHPSDPLEDGQELHIGRPGSLYRILSTNEMAARERETTVVVGAAAAKPSELRGGSSAFRRTAEYYEERQIPGPRRFGFGASPPRRNHYDQQSQQRPSPPRSTNHQDTPRQTILSAARGSPSSPSIGGRASLLSPPRPLIGASASNDVRALLNDINGIGGGGQTDDIVEDGLQTSSPTALFSQLAAVLGFDLAKKVTARHPRETDLNRLANLALDITTAPGVPVAALESGAAATSAPSRSASTTSATSTHSLQEQRSAARRGLGGHFNRPSGNRSPLNEQRRYGGGRSVRSSLGGAAGRTRANSTPVAAAAAATDDSFVTAVSAASAAAAVSVARSPAASSPRPQTVVSDEAIDVRTDATAIDDNEDDLIDWDGETAAPEEEHNEAVPSAHSMVECEPHLLD